VIASWGRFLNLPVSVSQDGVLRAGKLILVLVLRVSAADRAPIPRMKKTDRKIGDRKIAGLHGEAVAIVCDSFFQTSYPQISQIDFAVRIFNL